MYSLQDFLAERLLLDAIVTVVDAKHIEQHLDDKKPEGVENEVCPTTTFVRASSQHLVLEILSTASVGLVLCVFST